MTQCGYLKNLFQQKSRFHEKMGKKKDYVLLRTSEEKRRKLTKAHFQRALQLHCMRTSEQCDAPAMHTEDFVQITTKITMKRK